MFYVMAFYCFLHGLRVFDGLKCLLHAITMVQSALLGLQAFYSKASSHYLMLHFTYMGTLDTYGLHFKMNFLHDIFGTFVIL